MRVLPEKIAGLAALTGQYDALLCDIWGVVHDGMRLFPGLADCLINWRERNKPIVLLTNAPRPWQNIQDKLDGFGLPRQAYDAIISSGDATYRLLQERAAGGQICHFVGAEKDLDLLHGLAIEYAPAAQADFVLLTGLHDDMQETPDDYQHAIDDWLQYKLPLICANPDRMVRIGERNIYCAGAVAERYEQQGGEVIWLGKPYPPVYQMAIARLQEIAERDNLRIDNLRILAAGDGFKTDMPGANQAGLDALFITGGLANRLPDRPDTGQEVADFLHQYQAHARYFLNHLIW